MVGFFVELEFLTWERRVRYFCVGGSFEESVVRFIQRQRAWLVCVVDSLMANVIEIR